MLSPHAVTKQIDAQASACTTPQVVFMSDHGKRNSAGQTAR
jgi:hypothetical protein